jgi:hypothetical protein
VSDLTRLRIAVEDLEMVSDALTGRARDTAAVPVASNDRAEVARRLELAERIGAVVDTLNVVLIALAVVDPLVVVESSVRSCPTCAAVRAGGDRG